jgi:putative oxidoreductase
MNTKLSHLPQAPNLASLVLRLTVGVILLAHGLPKLQGGIPQFAGFVRSLGIPFPTLTAYATVAIEVVGGAMLVAGLLTRVWAGFATLLMIGTTLMVKLDAGLVGAPGQGSGMELDLLILAGALAVVLIGPGTVSLDRLIGIDGKTHAQAIKAPADAGMAASGKADPPLTISLDDEVSAPSYQRSR